jgi:hypothetical protein
MTDPKPCVSQTVSSADEDEVTSLRPPSRVSTAGEPKNISSAVWSALKCVDGFDDDDDEKAKATSEVKRVPFVVSEAKEDIETGSRSSKEATSEPPNTIARKATNVEIFQRKFDRDERPSAGATVAATAPLALQAPVPAHHGDDDGDEQFSAGAILAASAVETRRRKLERDEQTSVAHTDRRFRNPGAVHVEGLGLNTESDETFELSTTTPSSPPVRANHGDEDGLLVQATLVEDHPIVTAVALVPDPPPTVVLPDPPPAVVLPDLLPMKKWWHWSKFQCGGLILCLILVVGVSVGVAVGGSGGSDDGGGPIMSSSRSLVPSPAPSTASSFSFEILLAQSLPTNSQDAILVDDTREAQAFAWLQDDPDVSTFTNVEVLQRFALATLYYATGGENWRNNDGWLDYNVAECDWFTDFSLIDDFSFLGGFSFGNFSSIDSCINDNRYSNLALSQNGLSGELPDALAVLTDLQTMALVDNALTGQLPSALGSLSQLRVLWLYGNLLSGPVPSEYGLLLNLGSMYLYNNALTGTIPSTLGSLSQLTTLWLHDNKLAGSVPVELCQLVQTNGLDLQIDCDLVACDCGCVCA